MNEIVRVIEVSLSRIKNRDVACCRIGTLVCKLFGQEIVFSEHYRLFFADMWDLAYSGSYLCLLETTLFNLEITVGSFSFSASTLTIIMDKSRFLS